MKVDELLEALQRQHDRRHGENIVAIPYDKGYVTLGGSPFTTVQSVSAGFDWNNGKTFLTPETPLGATGDDLKKIKDDLRNAQERLAYIRMALTTKSLSSDAKVKAAISHLK
jgi:hypothetical protein